MSFFVLDSSVALSWCLPLEASESTLKVHELAEDRGAVVPELWHIEVTNILGTKLKNGVITSVTVQNALDLLASTPIITDQKPPDKLELLALMERFGLTAYDATYLELAMRLHLPIATLDRKLRRARELAGLPLLYELMS